MNPLPQRKKTAEEIAALRESLAPIGLPPAIAQGPAAQPSPLTSPAAPHPAEPASAVPAIPAAPAPAAATPAAPAEPRQPVEARPVTSLRKSEQGPSLRKAPAAAPANSSLPTRRRGDLELNQIRRAQAFEVKNPAAFLIALNAHPALVTAGYLAVFAAAALPFVDWLWASVPFFIPAVLDVAGLIIAAFIFLKKKRSLHHAGFIAAVAVFTIIFGALYYFPHLRNAP